MKWFWQKDKKKETPPANIISGDKDVIASIKYIVNKDGTYLHIGDFITLLTEYQKKCKDYTQVALLAQIITELKKAGQ